MKIQAQENHNFLHRLPCLICIMKLTQSVDASLSTGHSFIISSDTASEPNEPNEERSCGGPGDHNSLVSKFCCGCGL